MPNLILYAMLFLTKTFQTNTFLVERSNRSQRAFLNETLTVDELE